MENTTTHAGSVQSSARPFLRSAVVVALLLASCARHPWPIHSTPLSGNEAVIARFAGAWYSGEVLAASIQRFPTATLSLRVPAEFELHRAWTEGEEIHFSISGVEGLETYGLRFEGENYAVFVEPGKEPVQRSTCDPGLRRLTATDLLAARITDSVRQAPYLYDRFMDHLARVL